jgi:hypothetical protein
MRYADVGHGVWVGEYTACDEHGHEFPLVIHIWKPENWSEKRFCKRLHGSTDSRMGRGIAIKWAEGDRLFEIKPYSIEQIAAYAKQKGNIFVHCAGGVCLSLSLALVCKVARGCDIFDAIRDVYKGIWPSYGCPPNYTAKTIEDIERWAHGLPPKKD